MKKLNPIKQRLPLLLPVLLAAATMAVASIPVAAQSPVWKISQGDRLLYIGGTVHLLSQQDYPLPAAFDQAYTAASQLVFETDIVALKSPEVGAKLMQALLAQDGTTLKDKLKPATYSALETQLRAQGSAIDSMNNWSVTGVALIVTLAELQKMGFSSEAGVDHYFGNKGLHDGKTLGQLETIEQHLAFIKNLAQGQEDDFILKTLADIKTMPVVMEDLKKAWRTGDHQALETFGIKEIKADFPQVHKALLSDRNLAWLPQVESLLATPEVELVLVGALHLVGEDGLIALLKKRGFGVVNLGSEVQKELAKTTD